MIKHHARLNEDEWFKAAKYTADINRGRSGGNGALMRTVFPGLFYQSRLMAVETAGAIAQMTHWDEKSTEACNLYTEMIHLITEAVNGEDLSKPLEKVLTGTEYDLVELLSADEKDITKPTGYVVDSLKCALISLYTTRTLEDAIVKAANFGGDADTIAAITGGLTGAIYGYDSIPDRWIQTLAPETREQLDRLIDAAVKSREAK